jgi:hypothetical protein
MTNAELKILRNKRVEVKFSDRSSAAGTTRKGLLTYNYDRERWMVGSKSFYLDDIETVVKIQPYVVEILDEAN